MRDTSTRLLASTIALSLSFGLAACGGIPTNRTVYSVKQPVVERSAMALSVVTSDDGLPLAEQGRIASWFETVDLQYGDRITVEDPLDRAETRLAVARLAGRYGLMVSEAAPLAASDLPAGQARVVITRSTASVPGCPDWDTTSDATLSNGVSSNHGCATNSNLAAMIANPEDLIRGQKGSPDTYINTSTQPILDYEGNTGGGN